MRLKIDEYCKQFKMSREMVGSKLRAKRLNYIIEDGTTYILMDDNVSNPKNEQPNLEPSKAIAKPRRSSPLSP